MPMQSGAKVLSGEDLDAAANEKLQSFSVSFTNCPQKWQGWFGHRGTTNGSAPVRANSMWSGFRKTIDPETVFTSPFCSDFTS
ncbi:hypothetical protein CGZ80_09185 [Rhodopirellula sp. MGV]|nr:hypothetical protein CGZ80_09185 [Rhodopirellula sp. MGV]